MTDEIINTLKVLVFLAIGATAGHYHGQAQTYAKFMQGFTNPMWEKLK